MVRTGGEEERPCREQEIHLYPLPEGAGPAPMPGRGEEAAGDPAPSGTGACSQAGAETQTQPWVRPPGTVTHVE